MNKKKIEILKELRRSLLYYKVTSDHDKEVNDQFNEYNKSKEKVKVKTLYK